MAQYVVGQSGRRKSPNQSIEADGARLQLRSRHVVIRSLDGRRYCSVEITCEASFDHGSKRRCVVDQPIKCPSLGVVIEGTNLCRTREQLVEQFDAVTPLGPQLGQIDIGYRRDVSTDNAFHQRPTVRGPGNES